MPSPIIEFNAMKTAITTPKNIDIQVNPSRFKWAQKIINLPGIHFLSWLGLTVGAPYSANIRPRFTHVSPGHLELSMKKRRAVCNHMNTVHAVAMANLIELTASAAVVANIPSSARWIPSGMNIQYLKKAKTNLQSICKFEIPNWHIKQDLEIKVSLFDINNEEVAKGLVSIRVGPKLEK